jgi:hypothetical protein
VRDEDGRPYTGEASVSVYRGKTRVRSEAFSVEKGEGEVHDLPLGADRARVRVSLASAEVAPCPGRDGDVRTLEVVVPVVWELVVDPRFADGPRPLNVDVSGPGAGHRWGSHRAQWPATFRGKTAGDAKVTIRDPKTKEVLYEKSVKVTLGRRVRILPRIPAKGR